MYDFIADLDAFFCEKYANYDKICILPEYRMPVMQATKIREDGRTYGYTLPANTMRLALQEKKDELLSALKKQMVDKTFSFSFQPIGFFSRIKNVFSKYAFIKNFKIVLAKYNISVEEAFNGLNIEEEIKTGLIKGAYQPTKNLIFSLALSLNLSYEDTKQLLALCDAEFDYTEVKDVVIAYLLQQKVYNRGMIDAALAEYKVSNLFID